MFQRRNTKKAAVTSQATLQTQAKLEKLGEVLQNYLKHDGNIEILEHFTTKFQALSLKDKNTVSSAIVTFVMEWEKEHNFFFNSKEYLNTHIAKFRTHQELLSPYQGQRARFEREARYLFGILGYAHTVRIENKTIENFPMIAAEHICSMFNRINEDSRNHILLLAQRESQRHVTLKNNM